MKICIDCGIPIVYIQLRKSRRCNKCLRKHESRKGTSSNNRSKKHSERLRKYGEEMYLIYEGKCAICEWRITDEDKYLKRGRLGSFGNEIHHIVKVSDGGGDDITNLILLCPNHHKQADCGFISQNELKKYQVSEAEKEIRIKQTIQKSDSIRLNSQGAEDFL